MKKKIKDKWPGFVPPQLALLVDTPPEEKGWVHEIKFDGYRLQVHLKNNKIKLFTRNGNIWNEQFPKIVKAFEKLPIQSAIFDGEAVVLDDSGRSSFGKLQDALSHNDDSKIKFFIFDLLYLNGEDLRELSLKDRKEKLKDILSKSNEVIFFSEDVDTNGADFFKICCHHELEGIVSKDSNAPYRSGRSLIWCKSKCSKRQEFVVGGFTEGKGQRKSELGALLLGVYEKHGEKRKFRYVGKVGAGFDVESLGEVKKKVGRLAQKKSPFDLHSPKEHNTHWIKPKLVAEIKFSNWTADQILRQPVFLGFRNDKDKKDIVIEKVAHLTKSYLKNDEFEHIAITHPDKIIFPKEKITKQIIADYYHKVSPFMFPLINDRPLSLLRCPNGMSKKCFYQKHLSREVAPSFFKSFKVKEKSNAGIYISLNSPEGLRQLVQMNAFEIHTWNCHYQTLLNPDQIVMDFDPAPNVSFKSVVNGCLEMKKILDKLKLESFVKVTGGKGIHIHIPIEPLYSWNIAFAFSKALANEMVERKPDLYLSTMSKKLRKGKIFIDYFRNRFGATVVAPYAIRARKICAVALPVEWSELRSLKSSDQFTIKKALLKIKRRKSDPWKKFLSVKQKITILD
ncbi:MAG: DNA ligase D [Bacteriovorax sp.]|nr:DNA ligase D [Bacteriovorax sp.]